MPFQAGNSFNVGDLVKLRAGGQKMEIVEIEDNGAKCVWLIGSERHIAWVPFLVMVNTHTRRQPRPLRVLVPSV